MKLGELVSEIRYGFTGSAIPERNGVGFIRVTDIDEYGKVDYATVPGVLINEKEVPRYLLQDGDCIIARSGSVGKAHIYFGKNSKEVFASYLIRLRFDTKKIYPKYFGAFTHSNFYWKQILSNKKGGVQQNINTDGLSRIEIPVPDLKTQQKIASILEQADAARQKRKQANQLTEQFLQSAFLEMFGDPVRNEKEWDIKTFGELVEGLKYGTSLQCSTKFQKGFLPVLRIPNIIGGSINEDDLKYCKPEPNEIEKLKLKNGDILFVRSNGNPEYIGRCAIFSKEEEFIYASYLIRARLQSLSIVLPVFLQFHFSYASYRGEMLRRAKTTAGNFNINTESLRSLKIILPPLSLQQKFASLVERVEKLREKQRESERELENLFQSLMQRYFG
ncbi:MAG: restriction endonuclease subunit S [Bacteroidetes bacterium]|nr:restriction endonuclease subunit S [Bacteroidota bacterium]